VILTHDLNRLIERGGRIHIMLSTMGNFTRPDYIAHLRDAIPGLHLRIYHPPSLPFDQNPSQNLHLKAWLFRHRTGKGAAIIGSSNLTGAGFSGNIEWNYYTSGEINLPRPADGRTLWQTALAEYTALWQTQAVDASDAFIDGYRQRWQARAPWPGDTLFETVTPYGRTQPKPETPEVFQTTETITPWSVSRTIVPNAAQAEALQRLQAMRQQQARAAAVIAATGVGKTYLAALDFQQSGRSRLLFIAHRENILQKARQSFEDVLGPARSVIYGGGRRPDTDGITAVFAMIQTLSREASLEVFAPDAFDYLVVDEFHHAMAAATGRIERGVLCGYFQRGRGYSASQPCSAAAPHPFVYGIPAATRTRPAPGARQGSTGGA
jgi:hypothetical protein